MLSAVGRSRAAPRAETDSLPVSLEWNSDWRVGAGLIINNVRLYGCGFLGSIEDMAQANAYKPYFLGLNPCVEHGSSFPSKPLSYFCPVSCGCRSGDPHCPDTCPARTDSTPDCPAHQRSEVGNYCLEWLGWVSRQPRQPDQAWRDASASYPLPSASTSADPLICPTINGTCPLSPFRRVIGAA